MKNTCKIIWTNRALSGFKKNAAYLEENWTKKEIQKFARLLDLQLNRLNIILFFSLNRSGTKN